MKTTPQFNRVFHFKRDLAENGHILMYTGYTFFCYIDRLLQGKITDPKAGEKGINLKRNWEH